METLMYKPTSPNCLFVCMDALLKEAGVNIFQKNQNYSATRPEKWKTFPEQDFIIECNNSVTPTNLEELFENSG